MGQDNVTLRVGLLWHSLRAGNLGVGALTLANMAIVRDVAKDLGVDVRFVVISMREGFTESIAPDVEQFEIDTRSLLKPSGYARLLDRLDCVIDIGAGDSFTDIYGAKRFAFLWLSKFIAQSKGKPLIFAPQTIGPFTKPAYKPFARKVMRDAAAVVARDRTSLQAVNDIAPGADAHLAVDVAFMLPFEDRSHERRAGKTRVGINASGLLCHQAESGQNRFGLSYDYLALQRRLIEHWQGGEGVEVHLITHANSAGDKRDDDGHRADLLAKEFPGTVRVPNFAGPSEAKSYISSLDFLVAGRMHACIGAFSSLTPVVPIAYSRKFAGLFDLLGYPWYTPVTGMDGDAAFAFVLDAFARRDTLRTDEQAGLAKVDALMDGYRDVVRREFGALMPASR